MGLQHSPVYIMMFFTSRSTLFAYTLTAFSLSQRVDLPPISVSATKKLPPAPEGFNM